MTPFPCLTQESVILIRFRGLWAEGNLMSLTAAVVSSYSTSMTCCMLTRYRKLTSSKHTHILYTPSLLPFRAYCLSLTMMCPRKAPSSMCRCSVGCRCSSMRLKAHFLIEVPVLSLQRSLKYVFIYIVFSCFHHLYATAFLYFSELALQTSDPFQSQIFTFE